MSDIACESGERLFTGVYSGDRHNLIFVSHLTCLSVSGTVKTGSGRNRMKKLYLSHVRDLLCSFLGYNYCVVLVI